jgi:hypothetical protein
MTTWRRGNDKEVAPGWSLPEFTPVTVGEQELWRCTDCGRISSLPAGEPRDRHERTCSRLPYLLGQRPMPPARVVEGS